MSAPYRSEDQFAKLRAENDKLQREKDELMARFGMLKKWPLVAAFVLGNLGLVLGTSLYLRPSERIKVSALTYQDRRELAQEVSKRVNSKISAQSRASVPVRACSTCPVCANGVDERVLGMNKVVNGTLGGSETGPLSEDWKFSAQAGDEVIFRMKKKSGALASFLVLADGQGNILRTHDENVYFEDATLRYRFAFGGIYILRCMSFQFGYEGSYTLSATRVRTR